MYRTYPACTAVEAVPPPAVGDAGEVDAPPQRADARSREDDGRVGGRLVLRRASYGY
eukprot:COSAG02_NODE_2038_length_10038_cov_3.193480_4_plen_57_part_00